MSILIAIDFSKKGALSIFEDGHLDCFFDVPTKKIKLKPARYKFKHKDPKILIKSGPKKGERQRVIKTPAKTKIVIDFEKLNEMLADIKKEAEGDVFVVLESLAVLFGMDKGFMSKCVDHGTLHGLLISLGIKFELVHATTWKKALGVTSDKATSMRLAHRLFDGWKFSRDDEAEASLIGYWWLSKEVKKEIAA